MKNKFRLALVVVMAIMCFALATACGDNPPADPPPHTHTYSETLSHDDTHHWYAPTCEDTTEVKDKAEHTLSETVITESTWTTKGSAKKVCACGYETAPYELALKAKLTPEYTVPTGLTATVEDKLSSITLPAGFTWQLEEGTPETTVVGNAGENEFKLTYTAPSDTESKFVVVENIAVTVEVAKKQIALPAEDDTVFYYDGTLKTYEVEASNYYIVYGNEETAKDDYQVTIALRDTLNYEWADGTTANLLYDFVINAYDVSAVATVTVSDIIEGDTPTVEVDLAGFELVENVDYTVAVGNVNEVASEVTATVTFTGNFTGSVTETFAVKSIAEAVVASFSAPNGTGMKNDVTGSAVTLTVSQQKTVTDNATVLGATVAYTTATGAEGSDNGGLKIDSATSYYEVQGFTGHHDNTFTYSFDMNVLNFASSSQGHIIFATEGSQHALTQGLNITATMDSNGKVTLRCSTLDKAGSQKLYIEGYKAAYLNEYVNWTLVFDQTSSTTVNLKVYIDYAYVTGMDLTISEGYTFAQISDADYIGIGGVYGTTINTASMGASVGKNQYIDNIVFIDKALTANSVAKIENYVNAKNLASAWNAPETVAFNFMDLAGGTSYSTEVEIEGTMTDATLTGATLKNAPAGITLTAVDGQAGKYTLALTAEGVTAVKNGVDLTLSLNGYDKTFRVVYTPLDAIYASENISFYDLAIAESGISKTFKITADEAGTVGLTGVTFSVGGSAYDKITAGANAGEYTLTLTKADAEAITEAITVTATYEDLTTTFTITKNSFGAKVAASFSTPNGTGMTNDVAGSATTLTVSKQQTNTTKFSDTTPLYKTAIGADGNDAGGLYMYAYENYYEVQNFTGHQDNVFTYSLDINIQGLGTNEQAAPLFATEGGAGSVANGVHLGAAINSSGNLVIRCHANGKGGSQKMTISEANQYTGKYVNMTFVFTQKNATTIHIDFYIDYVKKAEMDMAVTEGYTLAQAADNDYIGIGGVYGSTQTTSIQDNNKNKVQYIDNIVFIDSALTEDEVKLIGKYNALANEKANAVVA